MCGLLETVAGVPCGMQDIKKGRGIGDSAPLPKLGQKSRLIQRSFISKKSGRRTITAISVIKLLAIIQTEIASVGKCSVT